MHQLRGPLGTMSGILNLMQLNLLTDDECENSIRQLKLCVESFEKSSRNLAEIIHSELK